MRNVINVQKKFYVDVQCSTGHSKKIPLTRCLCDPVDLTLPHQHISVFCICAAFTQ